MTVYALLCILQKGAELWVYTILNTRDMDVATEEFCFEKLLFFSTSMNYHLCRLELQPNLCKLFSFLICIACLCRLPFHFIHRFYQGAAESCSELHELLRSDLISVFLCQDMYGWPDEPFEEMDSTLAVQQVPKHGKMRSWISLFFEPYLLKHKAF